MNQVSLNLPRGWNALTTEQLEAVSRIFIDESRAYTASGHFDRTALLTKAFFALSGLRVISLAHIDGDDVSDIEKTAETTSASDVRSSIYYNCEFIDENERLEKQTVDGRVIPIRIYLNEIMSLAIGNYSQQDIDRYLREMERYDRRIAEGRTADEPKKPEPKSQLGFLLSPCTRTLVPYTELTLTDTKDDSRKSVTFEGPSEYMDGMTWRQYRIASDFMSYSIRCENELARLVKQAVKKHSKVTMKQIAAQEQIVREARASFMAALFNRPIDHIDPDTGLKVCTPWFVPSQCQDNAYLFLDLDEAKFQCVSFWWQGMMLHLQRQFPKVFRRDKVKSGAKDDDPLALYTRSTATMIKYAAANEEEVNRTSYTIILQHINDMAEENERIEKMKK